MARIKNPNLEVLLLAVDQLGDLSSEMVFAGGCATGLLITDAAAPPVRVTRDVDAIVEVVSRAEYYQLSEKLRARGFREDSSDGAPLCRWVNDDVILGVMPTDSKILGFGNEWYLSAINHADVIQLPNKKKVHLVSAPYFIITKLEAFDGRGQGDYLLSHDIEDIVAVLDGRLELLIDIKKSESRLKKAISDRFQKLQNNNRFIDAVSGHMPADQNSQARVATILKTIHAIAEIQ